MLTDWLNLPLTFRIKTDPASTEAMDQKLV